MTNNNQEKVKISLFQFLEAILFMALILPSSLKYFCRCTREGSGGCAEVEMADYMVVFPNPGKRISERRVLALLIVYT